MKKDRVTAGKMKIFFGYAAGVGKTYAMLETARQAKKKGMDVAVGLVETHGRKETEKLKQEFECIPCKTVLQDKKEMQEFDIDAALKRAPELILIDDLSHTNMGTGRHRKRYQDIRELLNAGMNVYTTIDVQNIESLNDTVASITGVLVQERIPDSVFDLAEQVEFVDLEPQELLERIRGDVPDNQEKREAPLSLEKLTALREVALRRCADRTNLRITPSGKGGRESYYTEEHILVCLSSSPTNAKIIRTAARMAFAFRSQFTALYVETPASEGMGEEDKQRLHEHIRLAEQMGARIETVYGEDIPYQIAEYSRISKVTQIVIGRSAAAKQSIFRKMSLTDRLIANIPDMDIHIIPDSENTFTEYLVKEKKKQDFWKVSIEDILKCVTVMILATGLGLLLRLWSISQADIIPVYILGVLLAAVWTNYRKYCLIASFASVVVFNFFFTEPRYTLAVHDAGYVTTFIIMFLVALISSTLASRLKQIAKQSARAAYRTKIMLETNQLLQQTKETQAILSVTADQLKKLLLKNIVMYQVKDQELKEPVFFGVKDGISGVGWMGEEEKKVAGWVLNNNKHAGASTDTFPNAKCLYLAIRSGKQVYAVVGIALEEEPIEAFENSILLSILGECAMALENERIAAEKEAAAILAKNEQLRADLLRSISHDLRTPLTSISGNAGNLLSNWKSFDDETMNQIFTDIYDDSQWLINLVENLLSVTRLEQGRIRLNLTTELADDVIHAALKQVSRRAEAYDIRVRLEDELMLLRIDVKLIVQVLINLLDNAVKYTPEGSRIIIEAYRQENMVMMKVADNGPGIPDEAKKQVFDMFYTGPGRIADSRRSMGLGLYLCQSIVEAHGGRILVEDNVPAGAVFAFTLPAGEVDLRE